MSENTHIGNRIQKYRKIKELSQEELAEAVDITQSYLSKIESGVEEPGRKLLFKLCNELGVSMDYLCYGEAEERGCNAREARFSDWLQKKPPAIQKLVLDILETLMNFIDEWMKEDS